MKYQFITGQSVSVRDIADAVKLDELVYSEEYRGILENCLMWYSTNQTIYSMIREITTNHLVAYVNIMPITKLCYNNIRNGDFIDVEITTDMICKDDSEYLYFSSVVVHPLYRNYTVIKDVLKLINDKLINSKNKYLLADAISKEGEKICEFLNMLKIKQSRHNSIIYEKLI